MKNAIFPGSFDLFHLGHKSIYDKAIKLFDNVIIYITVNNAKKHQYTFAERKKAIQKMIPQATIITDSKLTIMIALENNCNYIVRGIRNKSDIHYEQDLAAINKLIYPQIETILIFADESLKNISSSRIKESQKYTKEINQINKIKSH